MKCQFSKCDGRLRVTHTYVECRVRYQRAVCRACNRPHTITSTVEPAEKRGEGAAARAKRQTTA